MGLKKEIPVDPRNLLTSFNEGEDIYFDEPTHVYTHAKTGKVFKSATTWLKGYEDQFDSDRISASCSKKWGIPQEDILGMWESNGNAASGFGTAIHAVMEHYFTYKTVGKAVQISAGKEKNAALPNHPFLQQLIFDLEKVRVDGDAVQEALVSSSKLGICGLIDDLFIVDRKKKICRIRDYKITFDILVEKTDLKAPFGYLGGAKLGKNFVQLSFYGYLMSLSGWTIEGVDIYNWDGEWSVHTLEGPKLMKTMLLVGSELSKKKR